MGTQQRLLLGKSASLHASLFQQWELASEHMKVSLATAAETYEKGGFVYHTTMATDGLKQLRDTMQETADIGFDLLKQRQYNLGHQVHNLLQRYGYPRVAAPGFHAPSQPLATLLCPSH